jgi:hypothetical protein
MPTHWMIVTSPDNFERTAENGFKIQGIKSRHRKKAEAMRAGDRIVYYLTGVQSFAGTATITGPYFEDHEPIWQSKPGEDYPWRFPIRADVTLPPAERIRAESLLAGLQFVKKWPEEHWRLAFQGNVHILPEEDFALIESEMRAAV